MSQFSRPTSAAALLVATALLPLFAAFQDSNSINHQVTVSDHAPILQISSREGYVSESAVIGTTVRVSPNPQAESLQILVSDEDLRPGMPPATYQYILTGPGATIFAVDQRGYLYLNVPSIDADPPSPTSYRLNVQAREVDTSPIRSSEPVTIVIHVLNTNDNSPQFEQPIYTVNVTSFGDERPVVKVVLATDADSGSYGEITYNILQVTNGGIEKFRYDDATNTLYAIGDLTPGERYQVVIEATDGGGRKSQAIVVVLATHTMFSLASIAPLPGMETFIPNPAAYTTLATPTSAGQLVDY
ncbi:cadherin domain protein [Oesophagostomum dentatum]|uniref:Cadherin domain protein n=1 Tax=Oesophagostomum dentatum TaxID=61180 RepID=A0A0B1S1Q0_OESDE|nr:cadherin domain protein [Oesophagostomum dentatum]